MRTRMYTMAVLCGLIMVTHSQLAFAAQPRVLSFDEAIRVARRHAANLGAVEAKRRLADARVSSSRSWRHNPSIAVESGPRFGDETTLDVMIGVSQTLDVSGRPAARRSLEEARRHVVGLQAIDDERVLAVAAARAFVSLLYWQHRATLAANEVAIASEVHEVARRRNQVGDVGALDPSIASVALARSRATAARVEVSRVHAAEQLRWLVGGESAIAAKGDIRTVATMGANATQQRSYVALATAKADVARAEQHLARRGGVPLLTVGVRAGREEQATLIKGVLQVTLPFFWRGQADATAAFHRAAVHDDEAAILRARAAHELRVTREAVVALERAVAAFADEALPAATKANEIATASYRAGAIALPDLLVLRREQVAAEQDFAELLLLAALARVDALEASGSFPQNLKENP